MKRRLTATRIALLGLSLLLATSALADFRHARMGARPRALGSAYVALAEDANATYWNPAGLVQDNRAALMVTRAWMYDLSDIYNDYICIDVPDYKGFHFGASWVRLGIDDLYSENTLNLAVAHELPFLDGLSAGIAGKMFLLEAPGYEQYNDPYYNGGDHDWSLDLGLLYRAKGPWTLGATLYNLLEPELQLLDNTSDPDPVYTEWAVGGSYLFRETLLVTADLRNREGRWGDVVLHGGAEIWFFNAMALRAGLDKGLVTMGAGLQDKHWQVDFTLETDKNLGNVYMLSFTVRN